MACHSLAGDLDHPLTLLPDATPAEISEDKDEEDGDTVGEKGEYRRHKWSSKREYILSIVGFSVGLGNVWRFPYLCNRNGGGAFLIPFFLSLVLCGLPLFFLESALSQFTSRGPAHCWNVCPLIKGTGLATAMLSVLWFWHYNTVQAWALYYLAQSFQSPVPWSRCDQWWNTPSCADFSTAFQTANTVSIATSDWLIANNVTDGENGTTALFSTTVNEKHGRNTTAAPLVSAAEEFWQHNVLQVSSGFYESGQLVWYLVVCLAVACLFMCLSLIKGIKSSGKVVYVTAPAPYFLLTVLLIRGVTLPGAVNGIIFYLKPDFSRLLNAQVWVEAAIQVFYSLGPCFGGVATLASYSKFRNNCLRDSILLTFVCEATSIYGGFAIFSVLGYMAHVAKVPIDKVVSSGPGLAFIVYPEAISRMPLPQLWAVLFFLMIFTLCCDTLLTTGETVLTVLCDQFPRTFSRHRMVLTAVFCAAAFVLGLPFVAQGGVYVFQLVDWYFAALTVFIIGFLQCIALGWVYGADQFGADIQMMIDRKPPLFMTIHWLFLTPACLLVIFIVAMIKYQPPSYGSYEYDTWANVFGWSLALVSLVPIPAVALYQLYTAKGSFLQRLGKTLTPNNMWGPSEHKERKLYRMELAQRSPRTHWYDVATR